MKNIFIIISLISFQILIGQQGILISSEGYLNNNNGIITIVDGDFISESNTTINGGTLQMKALDGNQHKIELINQNTFDYLELSGTSSFNLIGQLTLNNELLFLDTSSFNLNTDSHLILGQTAEIVGESNTNTITGADGTYITTTRNHSAGITNDFGLIGVRVSNGNIAMGNTEVYRKYGTYNINGNTTVNRYYEINPTVNSDLNLDVRFYISDIDLNDLDRSSLAAFRSTNNGSTFTNEGGTSEPFYHSVTNLDAFSLWAFADETTLNIENNETEIKEVLIFPNPARHIVNIKSNNSVSITNVQLYDVLGKEFTIALSKQNTFNISNLSNGIYLLKITLKNNDALIKKLIVKK